jgi:hypothetical protein
MRSIKEMPFYKRAILLIHLPKNEQRIMAISSFILKKAKKTLLIHIFGKRCSWSRTDEQNKLKSMGPISTHIDQRQVPSQGKWSAVLAIRHLQEKVGSRRTVTERYGNARNVIRLKGYKAAPTGTWMKLF